MDTHEPTPSQSNQPHETFQLTHPAHPAHVSRVVLFGIAAFLVIISALGAGYLLTTTKHSQSIPVAQKQVETAPTAAPITPDSTITKNWKTYSDSNHSFTFTYPEELAYIDENGATSFYYADPANPKIKTTVFGVSTGDAGRNFEKLYEALPQTEIPSESTSSGKVVKLQNVTVGNQQAVQYAAEVDTTYTVWTLVKKDNTYVQIYSGGATGTFKNFKQIYDQILANFTFTNS